MSDVVYVLNADTNTGNNRCSIIIHLNAGIEVNLTVLTDCDIETDSEHNLKLLICLLHMNTLEYIS